MIFSALLAASSSLFSMGGGAVKFDSPSEGAVDYSQCNVAVVFANNDDAFVIDHIKVVCDKDPGFAFEQILPSMTLQKKDVRLILNNKVVGSITHDAARIDFVDSFDAHQKIAFIGLDDSVSNFKLLWSVSSYNSPSFDMAAVRFSR